MNNNTFQPGLNKLIHHQDHLKRIEMGEMVSPIHISVWPTNKCQLNCKYCCFGKTKRTNEELNIEDFKKVIWMLKRHGLKAVEFSGGGEPLLWTNFDEAVEYVYSLGLDLSLVTNGLELPLKKQEILSKFNWIRVSIQSLEYAIKVPFKIIPNNVRKSMSFIVYDEGDLDELDSLHEFAKIHNITIRVAPKRPCSKGWSSYVGRKVEKFGLPFLFFDKEQGVAEGCYFAWLRGAIDWKGMYLPCPSIELSPEYAGKIPDDFAVCHISGLESWLYYNRPHDMGYRCSHCNCGKSVNNFIHSLLEPMEDINFV